MKIALQKFWKFINTPIAILFLACILIPFVFQALLTVYYKIERTENEMHLGQSVILGPTEYKEVLEQIKWSRFELSKHTEKKDLVLLSTIKNESDQAITRVKASVLIYNQEGDLLDIATVFVQSEYIFPDEEYTTELSMKYGFGSMQSADLRAAVIEGKEKLRFEGRIESFSAVKNYEEK
jgi:hypothetical protein